MNTSNELKAGIFLIAAVLCLILGIWILGQERQIFSSKAEFYTSFKNVQGLSRGAPVRLSGISIGRIESIGFSEKENRADVYLTMSINADYLSKINSDAVASIQTQGLLGDKFLSIHPGKSTQILAPGSTIEARELRDVADTLQRAGAIINQTAQISKDIGKILADFKGETLGNINKTSNNLLQITEQIKTGKGILGELIYSESEANKIKKTLEELNKTAKNLETSTAALSQGTGTLGALLFDSSLYDNLVAVTDEAKRSFLLKNAIRSSLKDNNNSQLD